MTPEPSLRLRFTLAAMGVVLVSSALSALAVYGIQEYMEDELLLQLMQREVEDYARDYRGNPGELPPRSSELRSYVVDPGDTGALPPALRAIGPGIWHDVLIDGRNFQVANFTLQDKRLYLTYDITRIEQREAALRGLLAAGALLATALAGVLGWRLSRVVVAPVTRLVGAIQALDPGQDGAPLAPHFRDAELGAIAVAFDAYARRLGESIQRERAFTEDVSHELRTPLTIVSAAAERLGGDATLPEPLRPTVDRIARAARQMLATTRALLFIAREAEPPADTLQRLPLRQVLEAVAAAHQRAADARACALSATLSADGPEVPQGLAAIVVGNLLGNAIEHSGGARVELRQDGARVTVRDGGAGIAPEALAHIFERRRRGPHSQGLGLGLHIAKRICDHQGWTLTLASAPGQGVTAEVGFEATALTWR
jgi:signal transduction histidine kinase